MATMFLPNEITGGADGCVRAEEARRSDPLSPASSGFVVTDEVSGIVASVERIDAWMTMAIAGDRFVYATRSFLPAKSAGAARMRQLDERGLVKLTQQRRADLPDIFNYIATRTSVDSAMRRPVRHTIGARIIDAEPTLVDALLPVLDRAAKFKRPCPTDHQLAERSGLSVAEVAAGLEALTHAGLIRVFAAPRPTLRRVVIVATGQQTGEVRK